MVRFLVSLLAGLVLSPAMLAAAPKLVLFPFEMVDAAQDAGAMGMGFGGGLPMGPDKAEVRRLALITDDLRQRIANDARYDLISADLVVADVEKLGPIHKCNGCEDDIARKAGAEVAVIAIVEKLSDLLYNFNLYVRDVAQQKLTAVMSTTVQGSTDEAWRRGIRYLAERKLLQAGEAR